MGAIQELLLRESILKAVAARADGFEADALEAAIAENPHPDVFPLGIEGGFTPALAELITRGLIREVGSRLLPGPGDPSPMLARWFDALGGVTHVHGTLFRSPLPYEASHARALRDAGIEVVYSFDEAAPGALLRGEGLDWRLHRWEDNGQPTIQEMDRFLDDYLALPSEARVLIHCKAGLGRTGMAAACALALREGWEGERALAHFWSRVPLARAIMMEYGQAEFVLRYLARPAGRPV